MEFDNKLKIFCLIFLIIIIQCIKYIHRLITLLKNVYIKEFSSVDYKNKQDEVLDMCYKSRSLIYWKIRKLNESNLNTIQEKLKYLLIHESPYYKTKIVDKILVHDYSIKKLWRDICVPIIKIYNNANEIQLEELPDKFVLKCNHGSGTNIICTNKKIYYNILYIFML